MKHKAPNDIASDFRHLISKLPSEWLVEMRAGFAASPSGEVPDSAVYKTICDIDEEVARRCATVS